MRRSLVLLAFAFLVHFTARAQLDGVSVFVEDANQNYLPVTVQPVAPAVRDAILESLDGCRPTPTPSIRSHVSKNGNYAMYGAIFGNGQNFALTQFDGGVGFSEWKDENWQPEETLNITSEWVPKGGVNPYMGRVTPAENAFWTLDIGRGCRVAVIACDTEKYFQTFCVLQYNRDKKELEIVGPSMEPPRNQLGYLLTFNCSPRRAEWQAWDYFHVRKALLIHSAQWSEWRSNSNPDDSLTTLRAYNGEGGLAETFDVEDGWSDQNNYECTLSRSVANYSVESLTTN